MKIIATWRFTQRHAMSRPGAIDCGLGYILGLCRLGHDVYVFEEVEAHQTIDTQYNPAPFSEWAGVEYFERLMKEVGLWPRCCLIYDLGSETFAMSMKEAARHVRDADLVLDIGTTLRSPALLEGPAVRAYVDEAPAKTQAFQAEYSIDQGLALHQYFFSVGLNIGSPDCGVPTCGYHWNGIVHPVVLDMWPRTSGPARYPFSTITGWAQKETFNLNGEYSGEKSDQWKNLLDLPSKTSQPLEISVGAKPGYEADLKQLAEHGWRIKSADDIRTFEQYQDYISNSRGELSAANNRYVHFKTGWTSDRTARYLASGRPAIVQSTGAEKFLPTGLGLLTFDDQDGALAALDDVNRDYDKHARAARELAVEYFCSNVVLENMLDSMNLAAREPASATEMTR